MRELQGANPHMANPFARIARRSIATADGKAASRAELQRAVFAACKRLGLDSDARRDVQLGVTGKASLSDMDLGEIGRVLDALNRDWKGPAAHRAHLGKVKALWWSLYWLGALDDPKVPAIDAFVRRQTGIAALRFLDHRHAPAVIEALKAWCAREGVAWPAKPDELGDRSAVMDAVWSKLRDRGVVGELRPDGYVTAALAIPAPAVRPWTRHELDAALRLLGKRLRRAIDRPGETQ